MTNPFKIDPSRLTPADRQLRQNVRNYLYPMNLEEMRRELEISLDNHDYKRWAYVTEMIAEELNLHDRGE